MNKRKKSSFALRVLLILSAIILVSGIASNIQQNRYKRYAAQYLNDKTVGLLLYTNRLLANGSISDDELVALGYAYISLDNIRQFAKNVYSRGKPGMISESPSVWRDYGEYIVSLAKDPDTRDRQLSDLYEVTGKYVDCIKMGEKEIYKVNNLLDSIENDLKKMLTTNN